MWQINSNLQNGLAVYRCECGAVHPEMNPEMNRENELVSPDKAIIAKQEELIESQKEIIKFWNSWSQFLRNEDFDTLKKLKTKFYRLESELNDFKKK